MLMTMVMVPVLLSTLTEAWKTDKEAIAREYFDGSPCCALGPKKGPCWIRAGREKVLQARQESLELE